MYDTRTMTSMEVTVPRLLPWIVKPAASTVARIRVNRSRTNARNAWNAPTLARHARRFSRSAANANRNGKRELTVLADFPKLPLRRKNTNAKRRPCNLYPGTEPRSCRLSLGSRKSRRSSCARDRWKHQVSSSGLSTITSVSTDRRIEYTSRDAT